MADTAVPRKAAEIFAETVFVARARHRWTRQELADRCGVHRDQIWKIESGRLDPRLSTVEMLSSVLGIEVTIVERAA